jgi:hypothetical protein
LGTRRHPAIPKADVGHLARRDASKWRSLISKSVQFVRSKHLQTCPLGYTDGYTSPGGSPVTDVPERRSGGVECKESGESAEVKMAHVWALADGKITRYQQHVDTAKERYLIA